MKFTYKVHVNTIILFLWYLNNGICCFQINLIDDPEIVRNRLHEYYTFGHKISSLGKTSSFCQMSQEMMREACVAIAEAKAILSMAGVYGGQNYPVTNFNFRINDNSGDVLYTCRQETFTYKIRRNGKWSKAMIKKKDMFTCPKYVASFNCARRNCNHQKRQFKVSKGDDDDNAFVFEKPNDNAAYVEPILIATGLDYKKQNGS